MEINGFTITPNSGNNNGKISVVCEGANSPFITRRQNVINVQKRGRGYN